MFTVAMLTIWRPTPEIEDQLREGKRVQISHLTTAKPRCGRTSLISDRIEWDLSGFNVI